MRFPSVAAPLPKPLPETLYKRVPERYHGVWVRTLLETPEGRDTTTWVRWLQTSQWHADLRVPAGPRPQPSPAGLAQQQGFCGITQITPHRRHARNLHLAPPLRLPAPPQHARRRHHGV